MDRYTISNNYLEIIAGTLNRLSPVYTEAAEHIEKDSKVGLGYLKNFITSIEKISSNKSVKDERITKSKGNIKNMEAYENLQTVIKFLSKNLGLIEGVKDCITVMDKLEQFQPLYSEGYDKNIRLVVLEYESAVYMLITSAASLMANKMDVVANGVELKIQKKSATTHGIIDKTMADLAKQLNDAKHKDYLEELIKAVDNKEAKAVNENVSITESVVGDTVMLIGSIYDNLSNLRRTGWNLYKTFKRSLFGIIPLIRSIIYLRYKRKSDTILALEQQAAFIMLNIEYLQNIKTIDPVKKQEIIKKQKAYAEAYRKKAEKLRASLMEAEKETSIDIKKDDQQMKNTDDELVLESAIFFEKADV